jgi:hypothetical protein
MELQPGLDFPWQAGTEDVKVSRPHRTLLRECSLTGTVETGEVYSAAVTNDDGGCALHATWGVPCPHPRHGEGQWYECGDLRERVLSYVQDDVTLGRDSNFSTAYQALIDVAWQDQCRLASEVHLGGDGNIEREASLIWDA